jgi:hypothetical protein
MCRGLNVETDVHDVAILNHIILAFNVELPGVFYSLF